MDLEELNKQYTKFKNDFEKKRAEVEALAKRANDLADDKIIFQGKLIEAKRKGDKTAQKAAEDEIKRIENELKTIKAEVLTKKEEIKVLQEKIDEQMQEIQKDPEMKKHLEQVLSKKYERKMKKLEKEKEEAEGKKERLTNLQELITDHPALENNLIGITTATKEIKDLEKELKSLEYNNGTGLISYTDPARADEIMKKLIPQAQAKLAKNKTPLMAYIQKHKIDITEKDIDEFADGAIIDKNGKVDLKTSMTKSIAGLNRQIKGYEKSIRHHEIALNSVDKEYATRKKTTNPPTQTQEQPKWYQFAKRFKNWNEKRKQRKLPPPARSKKEDNKFKDSLKYDIVRDAMEQEEKQELRTAKETARQEDQER